jgi:hypothetical protein
MAEIKTIDINDLTKSVTVKVSLKGVNKFRVKAKIGTFLIRLGIRITGLNAEIDIEE